MSRFFFMTITIFWVRVKHVPHSCACSCMFSLPHLSLPLLKQLGISFLHVPQLASSRSPQPCIVAQDLNYAAFYCLNLAGTVTIMTTLMR